MTDEADSGVTAWKQTASVPATALNASSRGMLAKFLNPPLLTISAEGVQQDWMGLAELFGFPYIDIQNFKMAPDPFKAVFEQWTKNGTIGDLHDHLETMERFDILEDAFLGRSILRDVEQYKQRQAMMEKEKAKEMIQQPSDDAACLANHYVDEFKFITVSEVETGEPEYFDAYVCAANEDFFFVKQMIHMLEDVYHLKLCVIQRDLMPGVAKYTVIAKLISDRCKKMVIVLSPDYIRSPLCDFQTKFAQALSPGSRAVKIIPVLIRHPCPVPQILNFINPIDFTKADLVEWFWRRLARSLQTPIPTAISDDELFQFDHTDQLSVTQLSQEELNVNVPQSYYEGRPQRVPVMREISTEECETSFDSGAFSDSSRTDTGPLPPPCPLTTSDNTDTDSDCGVTREKSKKSKKFSFFSKKT